MSELYLVKIRRFSGKEVYIVTDVDATTHRESERDYISSYFTDPLFPEKHEEDYFELVFGEEALKAYRLFLHYESYRH